MTAPGAETAVEALTQMVGNSTRPFLGEVVPLSSSESAVVVDGRRVFIARAQQSPTNGDYFVTDIFYCEPYGDSGGGSETPETAPLVTPES